MQSINVVEKVVVVAEAAKVAEKTEAATTICFLFADAAAEDALFPCRRIRLESK